MPAARTMAAGADCAVDGFKKTLGERHVRRSVFEARRGNKAGPPGLEPGTQVPKTCVLPITPWANGAAGDALVRPRGVRIAASPWRVVAIVRRPKERPGGRSRLGSRDAGRHENLVSKPRSHRVVVGHAPIPECSSGGPAEPMTRWARGAQARHPRHRGAAGNRTCGLACSRSAFRRHTSDGCAADRTLCVHTPLRGESIVKGYRCGRCPWAPRGK